MKYIIVILIGFGLAGCSLFTPKRAAEIVPSCFSDGDNQERMCKAQHVNDDGKVVVTRCIGSKNREANPILRGKCVEKICSEGSNTDCVTRGEFRVLEAYSDLVTSNMFSSDEDGAAPAGASSAAKKQAAVKGKKGAKVVVAAAPAPAAKVSRHEEIDTDPSAKLPPMPEEKPVVVATPAPKKMIEEEDEEASAPTMSIALKPAKPVASSGKKKSRTTASVKGDDGFKRVCVSKKDADAPETLRGKCATRSCSSGKCSYKGRKEMFDYVARSGISE